MEDRNTALTSIAVILVSFLALGIFTVNQSKENISDWLTRAPITFLSKAQYELNKNHDYSSKDNLFNAIHSMQSIERYTSDEVKVYVDLAISELYELLEIMEYKHLSTSDINHAYFDAINAVAYAELRISEHEFEIGKEKHSLKLMSTVLVLLNKSLAYIPEDAKAAPIEKSIIHHVRQMIDKIKATGKFSKKEFEQINQEIEGLLDAIFHTKETQRNE